MRSSHSLLKSLLVCLLYCVFISHVKAAEDKVFDSLTNIHSFAFGGVGVAGSTSAGERYYWEILKRNSAKDDFLALLEKGNPQAKCYAITGLKHLDETAYKKAMENYSGSTLKVETMRGCVIAEEKLSDVLKQIDKGTMGSREPENREK